MASEGQNIATERFGTHSIVTVETFPARPGRPPVDVALTAGMTLGELLDGLRIPADTEAVIVNGVYVRPDYRLQPGDHVKIIPFMSGG
jgi:sulfur carrier protein ThiS